jgi:hypothetical protein
MSLSMLRTEWVGFDLGQWQGLFVCHNAPPGSTVCFASCAVGTRRLFLMDKPMEHEAEHEPLCRAKVVNMWIYTIHF